MKPVVKIALFAGLFYALTRKPEETATKEVKEVITSEIPLIPVTNIPAANVVLSDTAPIASTPPPTENDTPIFNEQILTPTVVSVIPKIGDTFRIESTTKMTVVKRDTMFNKYQSYFNPPINLTNKYATVGQTFKMVGEYGANVVVEIEISINGTKVKNYFAIPLANVKKV